MAGINETREKLRKEIQDLFRNLFLERDSLTPIDLEAEKLKSFSRLAAELAKKSSELELLLSVTEEKVETPVVEEIVIPQVQVESPSISIPEIPKIEIPVVPVEIKPEPQLAHQSVTPAKKLIDVKTIIGFNERLMFLNHLFNRDANAYEAAIAQINSCQSLEEAISFLSLVGAEYKWNSSSEPVFIFNSIVKRRFA